MKSQTLALFFVALAFCWRAAAQNYDTNNDVVQTFAGSGFSGYLDGVGQLTMFDYPSSVVADSSGNLFVCDALNHRVREIMTNAVVSTFAGGGTAQTGIGTNVSLTFDGGMAIDHSNNLLILGGPTGLYKITPNALVSTLPLNGINSPAGICVDSMNNLFISDTTGRKIFRMDTNGVIMPFVGSGNVGDVDGNGVFTSFNGPTTLAADAADNIYVFDAFLLRRIDPNSNVVTIAGNSRNNSPVDSDGQGTNASFSGAPAMAFDNSGNLLLACGSSIRKMTPATNVLTLAGSFFGSGYTNGPGNGALFAGADGVCFSRGTIFVADSDNQRIRSITFNPQPQVVSGANLGLATYSGLTITGVVGRTYQIQNSPDMLSWNTVATLLLHSSPCLWIDQNPVAGNKFYRAILLP